MCRKSFRRWTSGSFQSSHGYISRPTESDIRLLPSQSPSMTFTLLKDLGNNRFPSKYGRGGGQEGKIPQCDFKNHVGFLSTPQIMIQWDLTPSITSKFSSQNIFSCSSFLLSIFFFFPKLQLQGETCDFTVLLMCLVRGCIYWLLQKLL